MHFLSLLLFLTQPDYVIYVASRADPGHSFCPSYICSVELQRLAM